MADFCSKSSFQLSLRVQPVSPVSEINYAIVCDVYNYNLIYFCLVNFYIHVAKLYNQNKPLFCSCIKFVLFPYTVAPYDVNITGENRYSQGSQLQLHCSSEGGPQLEYSWSRGNTFSNNTTTNTNNLTVSNVTTLDGGNYTCTVTNDAGSSNNTVIVYSELILAITKMWPNFGKSLILACLKQLEFLSIAWHY